MRGRRRGNASLEQQQQQEQQQQGGVSVCRGLMVQVVVRLAAVAACGLRLFEGVGEEKAEMGFFRRV